MPGFAARIDLVSRDLPGFVARIDLVSRDLPGFAARVDFVSPRPARIADQAYYGPLNPASLQLGWTSCHRDLPADQADYSPLYPTSLRLG